VTSQATEPPKQSGAKTRLRILSYNIQVGIGSTRFRHYVTQSWKHVLPHPRSFYNLDRIAQLISDCDVVALQEVDAGSLRTGFVNQTEYLADRGGFPFWYHQTNRKLGKVAQHAMGLLSKFRPSEVTEYRLPGLIPGRGAMLVRFGHKEHPLIIILIHLALGRRARSSQIDYISDLVKDYEHVILMGDLNCAPDSYEMDMLFEKTQLREPEAVLNTFPSWRPLRNIDHILATPSLDVKNVNVLHHPFSDHLPIAMELEVPAQIHLAG